MKNRGGPGIQECYRILKVNPGADWSVVKKSFYALAQEYHPDRNAGSRVAEEEFKKISCAYETLERWTESRMFSYRVYSHAASVKDRVAPFDEEVRPFDFLPERVERNLNRWTRQIWNGLRRFEEKWLELDVKKEVAIDPVTACQGGSIKIKNSAGSFLVQVPPQSGDQTVLRVPGKGEKGFFNRVPGNLLLTLRVDSGRQKPAKVTEYFYQVKVVRDGFQRRKVRTIETPEGPIQYLLPKNIKSGQSIILKTKPRPQIGKVSHHILVIELL
ncbi:MAG: DnaJ domain-containing protein [Nitrospinota bacterium]|nr:DnaJ domain-containing protein [Nitrospinota bacterium]